MSVTPPTTRSLERSRRAARARRGLIPGATQTLSKGPTQWVQGVAPAFLERGEGAHVWDVDGNEYLDYPMALGPVILGYAHPAVERGDRAPARATASPSRCRTRSRSRSPSGSSSSSRRRDGALRQDRLGRDERRGARGARRHRPRRRCSSAATTAGTTGTSARPRARRGVPEAVRELIDERSRSTTSTRCDAALARARRRGRGRHPRAGRRRASRAPGFLEASSSARTRARRARRLRRDHHRLPAARRAARRSATASAPTSPCFGKALGNGMPISALAGSAEVMDVLEEVFFSGTHGGETLSLAAAAGDARRPRRASRHEHLWRLGERLRAGIAASDRRARRRGVGDGRRRRTVDASSTSGSRDAERPRAAREERCCSRSCCKRGVLFNGSNFICARPHRRGHRRASRPTTPRSGASPRALPDGVDAHPRGRAGAARLPRRSHDAHSLRRVLRDRRPPVGPGAAGAT